MMEEFQQQTQQQQVATNNAPEQQVASNNAPEQQEQEVQQETNDLLEILTGWKLWAKCAGITVESENERTFCALQLLTERDLES